MTAIFKKNHAQVCEEWKLLTAAQRAQIMQPAFDSLLNSLATLTEQQQQAQRLFAHLFEQAPLLDERQQLTGATGESNELYVTARGKTMIIGTDSATLMPVLGQLLAALLTGNEVILHYPSQNSVCEQTWQALIDAGVPEDVISIANDSQTVTLLHMGQLAAIGVVGVYANVQQISSEVAKSDGILTQVIAVTDLQNCHEMLTPDYIYRYTTERVMTINTTAIGGNASLIELSIG